MYCHTSSLNNPPTGTHLREGRSGFHSTEYLYLNNYQNKTGTQVSCNPIEHPKCKAIKSCSFLLLFPTQINDHCEETCISCSNNTKTIRDVFASFEKISFVLKPSREYFTSRRRYFSRSLRKRMQEVTAEPILKLKTAAFAFQLTLFKTL